MSRSDLKKVFSPHIGVEVTRQIADKTQINALFDMTVEIVIWDEVG